MYLPLPNLGRQFAAYLGTPTRARGYPAIEGDHGLIVEVAPRSRSSGSPTWRCARCPRSSRGSSTWSGSSACSRSTTPTRSWSTGRRGILEGIGATPADALRPNILYADVIEQITDQHAVIINRNREAMVLPGETLLVYEVTPALFAAVAANAAERVAPEVTLVTVSMIGAAGRIYLSGPTESVERARDEITRVLESVEGREH